MSALDYNQPVSYREVPDTLKSLCCKIIIKRPSILTLYIRTSEHVANPDSALPYEISDLLARAFRDYALTNELTGVYIEKFFRHFIHEYIPLSRIDFSGLPINEAFFDEFFNEYKEQLQEINISNCDKLSKWDLRKLNGLKSKSIHQNRETDKTFIIGETCVSYTNANLTSTSARTRGYTHERIFNDHLRIKKLVLHKLSPPATEDEFTINRHLSLFLAPQMGRTLRYLDLSSCTIGKGSALMQLESLEILILYNCKMNYPDIVTTTCQLQKLHTLDISREVIETDDSSSACIEPQLLDILVTKLPQLKHLDISGTDFIGGKDRNITAFEMRTNDPFRFLGLFHTGNDAAFSSSIPAYTVAGEANETQILNACEAYMDRPEQLSKALSDLYNLYKTITPSETNDSKTRALDVVLPILARHISDEQVIIFTTAALWCIVKIDVHSREIFGDTKVRRVITSKLLDVMHYHRKNAIILINGGLTLLLLPDIICEHSRLAAISLYMCQATDPRTQSFGATLLNTLACQVGGDQKIHIGQLRAIEIMIDIIEAKIREDTCDEILETAWSTLWNITDETPVNCERFLDCGGMNAFESCMDRFHFNKEVLRNIMGLLGNVAECQTLRSRFMTTPYIQRFESLLSSSIDGIECSYNACGILAHLISDGERIWDSTIGSGVSRKAIMRKMCTAISEWPINSRRNINYRSFEPIIRLLDQSIDPAAQYWATFALANLTRINPAKYCPMLLPFGGLEKLRLLTEPRPAPYATAPYVANLAYITIYQYNLFKAERTLIGLEHCDSVDMDVIRHFRADSSDEDSDMGEIIL